MAASSSSMDRYRDWSNGLSADLFGEIISRLTSCGDRVRFAAVSKSWRQSSAAFAMISRNGRRPSSHPPWLVVPGSSQVCSFSERKWYQITDERLLSHRCIGSGTGWIIVADNLDGGNLQLIYNLHNDGVNGRSNTRRLPPITTLPDMESVPRGYVLDKEEEEEEEEQGPVGRRTSSWNRGLHTFSTTGLCSSPLLRSSFSSTIITMTLQLPVLLLRMMTTTMTMTSHGQNALWIGKL